MSKNNSDWKCCICSKPLNTFEDCAELWVDGSRVHICKNPECRKKYAHYKRRQSQLPPLKR